MYVLIDDDMKDNVVQQDKPKRPCDCRNITKLVSPTRTICSLIPTATRAEPSPLPITPSTMVTAKPSNRVTAATGILTASTLAFLLN